MPFTTSLGALLGGATEQANVIHNQRFQQEQADRKFAYDMLTHIMDDPNIGNPQVKEQALQELHGRMLESMYPDNYSHKPNDLGKMIDKFIGINKPQGALAQHFGAPQSAGPGQMTQPGVGSGNATTPVGGMTPQPGAPPVQPQALGNVPGPFPGTFASAQGGIPQAQGATQPSSLAPPPPPPDLGPTGVAQAGPRTATGAPAPQTAMPGGPPSTPFSLMPLPQDPSAALRQSGDMSESGYVSPRGQIVMDNYKKSLQFQSGYQDKLNTWNWLSDNDPMIKAMNPQEKELEHARFMYNMVTPVSYLKDEPGKDDLPYSEASKIAGQYGIPMPAGTDAASNQTFRVFYNMVGQPTGITFGAPYKPEKITGVKIDNKPESTMTTIIDPRGDHPTQPIASFETNAPAANQPRESVEEEPIPLPDGRIVTWNKRRISGPVAAVNTSNAAQWAQDNGGREIGQKNIPEFLDKLDANRGAMLLTTDLAEKVRQSLGDKDGLGGLIDAGKLSLAISPSTGELIVSHAIDLTEKQKDLAANMQSLAEHINTLRGPLGATGFRGAEAFAALQGQRGNLFAQPEITKRVLNNTLKALTNQIGSSNRALGPAGRQFPTSYKNTILGVYKDLYGKDYAQKLRDDGY